jgi:hypothetical protein
MRVGRLDFIKIQIDKWELTMEESMANPNDPSSGEKSKIRDVES